MSEQQCGLSTSSTSSSASPSNFFKQIDEKNTTNEVSQMLWNPKMDLIAVAFSNGDIHLNRMSWQRVWSVSPPHQNLKVSGMSWRPDGKSILIFL